MDKEYVINKLLEEIGLCLDDNFHVVDQDVLYPVLFMGNKLLKYNPNGMVTITRDEAIFDPINNVKQMFMLFNYYLKKIQTLDDRTFSIFYNVPVNNGKHYVEIKSDNGSVIDSRGYYNEALRYIDLIFKISESDIDLTSLDFVLKQ